MIVPLTVAAIGRSTDRASGNYCPRRALLPGKGGIPACRPAISRPSSLKSRDALWMTDGDREVVLEALDRYGRSPLSRHP